jgi:hypothetical protein
MLFLDIFIALGFVAMLVSVWKMGSKSGYKKAIKELTKLNQTEK